MPRQKKEKKRRRRQQPCRIRLTFSELYPFDVNTGADLTVEDLDKRFRQKLIDNIADILGLDDEIRFDQDDFKVHIKID